MSNTLTVDIGSHKVTFDETGRAIEVRARNNRLTWAVGKARTIAANCAIRGALKEIGKL